MFASVCMHVCRWQKQGPILDGGPEGAFDSAGVGARCVVKDFDSRQYFMFYEGLGADGRRSIGVAVSDDGLSDWKRHSEPVLRGGEVGAWDEAEVGAPCAVSMAGGRWRLYYSGAAFLCSLEILACRFRSCWLLCFFLKIDQDVLAAFNLMGYRTVRHDT